MKKHKSLRIGYEISCLRNIKGGISNYVFGCLKGLMNMRSNIEIIPLAPSEYRASLKSLSGKINSQIRFYNNSEPINFNKKNNLKSFIRWGGLKAKGVFLKSKNWVKEIDVCHSTSVHQIEGRKNIVNIYDLTARICPEFHTKENLEAWEIVFGKLKEADRIITISRSAKEDILKHLKQPESKVDIVYPAAHSQYSPICDSHKILAILKKYNIKKPYALFVGVLEPRKNVKGLLRAFQLFKEKKSLNSHSLILVGGKGWGYDSILETIESERYKSFVRWLGFVSFEDMPFLYNGADVFLYPSFYEGFGMPVLEAMACGIPTITSNTSSMPEMVGEAGLMVNPHDTEAIAKTIELVVNNRDLHKDLSARSIRQAQKYSWEASAKSLEKVYNSLINNS